MMTETKRNKGKFLVWSLLMLMFGIGWLIAAYPTWPAWETCLGLGGLLAGSLGIASFVTARRSA